MEPHHQVDERLRILQRLHGSAHGVHTDKQDSQSSDDLAIMAPDGTLDEHDDGHATEGDERGQSANVQHNQLGGDGGADVGTHDDPDRLLQGHHA